MIYFRVLAVPAGEPRARARRRGNFASVHPAETTSSGNFRDALRFYANAHIPDAPFSGPVCVDREYVFPRPKTHYKSKDGKMSDEIKEGRPYYHTGKPDVDNIDKLVFDTLESMGFFTNDSIVCVGMSVKRYVLSGTEHPCAKILIRTLPERFEEVISSVSTPEFSYQRDLNNSIRIAQATSDVLGKLPPG